MRARRGYTIVEVLVATLLAAVLITAVFTVALSNKRSNLKQDSMVTATTSAQGVQKMLASYITADWVQNVAPGPNNRGTNSWSLDGDDYTDNRGAVWALAPGSHTITGKVAGLDPEGLLPRLRSAPYYGTLRYCVQWLNCPSCTNKPDCSVGSCTPPLTSTCRPNITITSQWTQP